MVEFILLIIFILSLWGMAVILLRKIPILIKLPEAPTKVFNPKGIKSFLGFGDFSYELYLQKILSRIRVLTLKTDNKTSGWLEKLRQKKNKENGNNDKYWEELKRAKDGK